MLFRHTSQYMISSVVVAVLGFLSAAVFTRLLTPDDYGVYVVGFGVANFVSSMMFTWVRYSVMRFESEGDRADVRMTALAAYIVSALLAPLLVVLVHSVAHIDWTRSLFSVVLSLGLSLFEMSQEMLRSRLKVRAYMIGSVLRSALAFGVCIVIAKLGGGGMGQLAGAALAYYLASALTAGEIWKGPRAPMDADKLRLFFWLGLSITAGGVFATFQLSLDRLFLAWRFGDAYAGLYGASADVVKQIILIPAGSVAAAAFPLTVRIFTTGSAEDTRRQLARTGELLLAVLAPAAVGLGLTAPYLVSFLLGPSFRDTAVQVMPIVAFAWLFQSLSQSYIHVSYHLAMKQWMSIPHGIAALGANCAMLWPLTTHFGFIGAAWSLLISEAFGAVVSYLFTLRAYPLPLVPGAIRRVAVSCGWMAVGVHWLERYLTQYSAGAFLVLAVVGGAIYLAVGFLLDLCESRTTATRMFATSPWGPLLRRLAV